MSTNTNKTNSNPNIKEIFLTALNKWYLLIIIFAVCISGTIIYSYFLVTPLYDSTGKIYIMRKDTETINTGDLSVSSYLTRDYENLIVDRAVLDEVSRSLDNKYSYPELKSAVTVENPEDTRFIEITVRTASAEDSKRIVDTICRISQEKIIELLGIDRVTIIREGNIAKNPSVPNITRNLLNSFILGLLLFITVILLIYFFNDKINSAVDVQKHLETTLLGNIPHNPSKAKSK